MKKELRFGFGLMALILLTTAIFMPWTSMTNGHLGLLMLSLVVVAIMLGFPTAFTLMGMGVFFAWLAYDSTSPDLAVRQTLDLMVQRAYAVMSSDVLIAIPLFVFMGYLVERANLIEKVRWISSIGEGGSTLKQASDAVEALDEAIRHELTNDGAPATGCRSASAA